MSKSCPLLGGRRVVYLECLECTDRVCEKRPNYSDLYHNPVNESQATHKKPQVTILPKKSKPVHDVSRNSNSTSEPVQEPKKECESTNEKCPDCSTCFNQLEEYDDHMFGNLVKVTRCKVLTNQLVFRGQVAITGCPYHNRDMSKERICLNCEHYLGMGDWGLGCKVDYYKIPGPVSEACEKFNRKEEDDG